MVPLLASPRFDAWKIQRTASFSGNAGTIAAPAHSIAAPFAGNLMRSVFLWLIGIPIPIIIILWLLTGHA
jgi:hypothetical protein